MNTIHFIRTSLVLVFAALSQSVTATSTPAEPGAVIAAQSRLFTEALSRGDARAAARVFTTDARLIVSGVSEAISGRTAIEGFWLAAIGGGLREFELTTHDIEGDGALRIETGTYRARGAGGVEAGHGHYLFVWKQEGGVWRIHRDFGSAMTTPASTPAPAGAAASGKTFPANYRGLEKLGTNIGKGEPAIHTVYANDHAAVTLGEGQPPFPAGSLLIMEFANSVRDGEGELVRERDGTPVRGEVIHVDVMRRGPGFGIAYGDSRAGEWEFSSFRPDGGVLVAPENGAQCAACHRNAGVAKDFVFRIGSAPAAK